MRVQKLDAASATIFAKQGSGETNLQYGDAKKTFIYNLKKQTTTKNLIAWKQESKGKTHTHERRGVQVPWWNVMQMGEEGLGRHSKKLCFNSTWWWGQQKKKKKENVYCVSLYLFPNFERSQNLKEQLVWFGPVVVVPGAENFWLHPEVWWRLSRREMITITSDTWWWRWAVGMVRTCPVVTSRKI